MAPAPKAPDRRLHLLQRMAWLCAALMLATITLSAFMRLSQAGLGCADWPGCYAQQGASAAAGHGVAAARLAHRIVASATLILVIIVVMTTLATRPVLKRPGALALALALLLLALGLALLGIVTPGARLPAVAMGNLLGGFVMLALCARLAASAGPQGAPVGLGLWAIAGLALLCAQLAGGALVGASYAALSCADLADCTHAAAATGWDWLALNPWREPGVEARGSALALWLHRIGAAVVLPVLALLGLAAWRRGRHRGGAALLLLAALQGALGLLIAAAGLPLAAVLLHNLVAALLLATLVRLI